MNKIEEIYKLLEEKAYANTNPFVACLVDKESFQILEFGYDHHWISPILHCETQAIHKVATKDPKTDFSKTIMISTAEPCPMCQAAIMWTGIEKVYFGASREFLVAKGMDFFNLSAQDIRKGSNQYKGSITQIEEKRCEKIFNDLLEPHMSNAAKQNS